MAEENTVLYEVRGAVATVTINRPHRRNAMLSSMLPVMIEILRKAADDSKVRVLILRGAASDFCPGADLDVTASGDTSTRQPLTPEDFLIPVLLHEMPAVTIAAIQGACAGAGLGWALGCDLRFASPSARFNTAFLDVGVAGDMGGPWSLPRVVGPAKARELYFMPGKFDAEEALRIGLVSRLFSDSALHDEVRAIANRMADAAPIALRTMKANFLAAEHSSFRDFIALESRHHLEIFKTEDTREAFRAKVEKRRPIFKGR
ncbi:MAG: enoyl-CoA hydratase/isomerase family protein [Rhizomicrobium sp.]